MNAKRWFAWVCLALMLVAEVLLFHANHERDQARADLTDAQKKLHDTEAERDDLKNSSSGQQATEITNLHKQNDVLMAKVSDLQRKLELSQRETEKAKQESQQASDHLTTARSALELQQAHLQQLQVEQQQQATAVANGNACINNLRIIDAAKQQWALEKGKTATDVPTAQDLLPYFKDGNFPMCPDGGTYTINALGLLPVCSVQGHVLPPQ